LQKKREELALRYRDHLRDLFGTEEFQRFENFTQQKMSSVINVMPVESLRLTDDDPTPVSTPTERRIEK
jgi:hypothetical protein